jgi:hypothetical protein
MQQQLAGQPHLIYGQALQDVLQVCVRIKFVELDQLYRARYRSRAQVRSQRFGEQPV